MSDAELPSTCHSFYDPLKDGAEITPDSDPNIDNVDRAEGIRTLLRRQATETSQGLEGGDESCPQLAWSTK